MSLSKTAQKNGSTALNINLSAEASADLARIQRKTGETKTAIIERLLRRAAARVAG